jgi:CBS-domain-containing membrane protein
VPVVDETGRMIGIVSHTDILQVFEDAESRLEDSLDEGDAQAG